MTKKEKKKIKKHELHKLILRNISPKDYSEIEGILNLVSSNVQNLSRENFFNLIQFFPEGQFCIEDNGKVVAFSFSLVVKYSDFTDKHNFQKITGDLSFKTHNLNGDTLFGIDTVVHPKFRGLRLGRRLYDARKELVYRLNLKRIILAGKPTEYRNYTHKLTIHQYISKVQEKEIFDSVISFLLANDFHVRKIIPEYFSHTSSAGILCEWINIYHEEKEIPIGTKKSVVRLGVVQWGMRSVDSTEDFLKQFEFFVDAVAGYKADFVLFPEFFNVPLMAKYNQQNPADAIRSLAQFTEGLREEMLALAVSYNINIISGSMPVYKDSGLYNVSYLLRRDGTWDEQYKIHITPDEASYWGVKGGNELKVFETDVCKIGILICFDVEFPELPRLLAEKGMEILFVPFSTDTKNGYQRVRHCAHARAIENECYVAISGSVGNLPYVENMDIQYAQSAVFTPSDFAFAHDAIAAEATPNTEMTLIVDVDLDLLKELKVQGSVRNLNSRRHDLYRIQWHGNS
jgi:predicted amidohydrolase/GNAT superfamily N-acetyltransferase